LLPAIAKVLSKKDLENKTLVDIGCGTGFFLQNLLPSNMSKVVGVDVDEELLQLAKQNLKNNTNLKLFKMSAEKMTALDTNTFDFALSVESLPNIENLDKSVSEMSRILKINGKAYVVVNHPSFRIPQNSDWFYDEKNKRQGRIVYKYKTAQTIKIDMNPGTKVAPAKKFTYTFHRSLAEYINTFTKNSLQINKFIEIYSNKQSQFGDRKQAEDMARNEIPMFLLLELIKTK
jgi:ubiquinone/menaquinone biosynthesis C-methylase UbiE